MLPPAVVMEIEFRFLPRIWDYSSAVTEYDDGNIKVTIHQFKIPLTPLWLMVAALWIRRPGELHKISVEYWTVSGDSPQNYLNYLLMIGTKDYVLKNLGY